MIPAVAPRRVGAGPYPGRMILRAPSAPCSLPDGSTPATGWTPHQTREATTCPRTRCPVRPPPPSRTPGPGTSELSGASCSPFSHPCRWSAWARTTCSARLTGARRSSRRSLRYAADPVRAELLPYLQVPFLFIVPAVFAVVWVSRRGAPRLTTVGALIALTGFLVGFGTVGWHPECGDARRDSHEGLDIAAHGRSWNAAMAEQPDRHWWAGLLFILGVTVGLLLLGLAMWRSHVGTGLDGHRAGRRRLHPPVHARATWRPGSGCWSRLSVSLERAVALLTDGTTTTSTCRPSARPRDLTARHPLR